jgi:transposase
MPAKQHVVQLTESDEKYLRQVIGGQQSKAREMRRAYTLLMANEQKRDQDIAEALQVQPETVSRTRQRYCEVGLPEALQDKPRPGAAPKLDGKQEAIVVALACSETPDGRKEWTMQMLADKLVELKVVDSISDETVRRTLKKKSLNPG